MRGTVGALKTRQVRGERTSSDAALQSSSSLLEQQRRGKSQWVTTVPATKRVQRVQATSHGLGDWAVGGASTLNFNTLVRTRRPIRDMKQAEKLRTNRLDRELRKL